MHDSKRCASPMSILFPRQWPSRRDLLHCWRSRCFEELALLKNRSTKLYCLALKGSISLKDEGVWCWSRSNGTNSCSTQVQEEYEEIRLTPDSRAVSPFESNTFYHFWFTRAAVANSGSSRMSQTDADVDLNLMKPTAMVAGLVIILICISLSVVSAGWVFQHRKSPVVKVMQLEFLIILCFGTILLKLTILPAGMNDTNPIKIDRACMALGWLHRLGELFIFTSLFLKLWRVNQIFKVGGSFWWKAVPLKWALCTFTIFLALNIFFLITGTVMDPMEDARDISDLEFPVGNSARAEATSA